MIAKVLQHMGGIDGYGVISICLFFGCFLGVLVTVCRLHRPYLEKMSALPLDADETETSTDAKDHD